MLFGNLVFFEREMSNSDMVESLRQQYYIFGVDLDQNVIGLFETVKRFVNFINSRVCQSKAIKVVGRIITFVETVLLE